MANPIVTGLTNYVNNETNKNQLIRKAVLDAKSADLFTLQTGVKGPTTINLLNTSIKFGDGSTCGFVADGSSTISQRTITPAILKVNMEFCDRNLLKTYAQHQVLVEAGREKMPFEEAFLSGIAENTKAHLETLIWQGNATSPTVSGETQFDGILTTLTKSGSGAIKVVKGATESETVLKMYNALPNNAHAEDTVIFAAPSKFRAWIQELVAANMYHWNANDKDGEYYIPGTSTRVIAVPGLEGATGHEYVAGRLSNFFYGTDLEGSEEEIKVVYDEVKEAFLVKILFSAGVQVAWPNEVAYVAAS